MTVVTILLGMLVVLLLTAATGYFVAQEFAYMAVDRSRLKARAADGDAGAQRALGITRRTSFMLSGAQLGITVTGLLVGYVAEPLIGAGVGSLLGGVGIPTGVGIALGTVFALLFSTVVQMVFGELFPKNLAIAKPEPVARWLAWSTHVYLAAFGWLIKLFDHSSNLLLKALRIEPVHDVEHAATPKDLERIVAESRASGDLPGELSTLLDRALDLHERDAEHAMIPRPRVATVPSDATLADVAELMAAGHSRYPVLGDDVDDVRGIVCLKDVLALDPAERSARLVRDIARPPTMVPSSLPLRDVLTALRGDGEQLACVIDEYGGFAGVITVEDIAEELVGEIADEHDLPGADTVRLPDGSWVVDGGMHVDEVERLLGHELPQGDYETIGGLVITELGTLPSPGDAVTVALRLPPGADEDAEPVRLSATVGTVDRRVPARVRLHLDPDAEEVTS
ncbi:hemolysin family protein [Prauserella oleivorans]|uniref:Hemolysin family protein n=1 Tax=Prauserella oleivorans TaxID=1478153 RepID=A0ABW5WGI3_9PSEU